MIGSSRQKTSMKKKPVTSGAEAEGRIIRAKGSGREIDSTNCQTFKKKPAEGKNLAGRGVPAISERRPL